jgi:hypothetical protein
LLIMGAVEGYPPPPIFFGEKHYEL